jgi:hypothetical protein
MIKRLKINLISKILLTNIFFDDRDIYYNFDLWEFFFIIILYNVKILNIKNNIKLLLHDQTKWNS